jgi:hypothetical protein
VDVMLLQGNEPKLLGLPVYNLVAIPTELSQLRNVKVLNAVVRHR